MEGQIALPFNEFIKYYLAIFSAINKALYAFIIFPDLDNAAKGRVSFAFPPTTTSVVIATPESIKICFTCLADNCG